MHVCNHTLHTLKIDIYLMYLSFSLPVTSLFSVGTNLIATRPMHVHWPSGNKIGSNIMFAKGNIIQFTPLTYYESTHLRVL